MHFESFLGRHFVKFKNWISDLLYNRRLQVDIVTIFLFLISSTTFFIIFYTYSKNSESILARSKTTIERTGEILLEKTSSLINSFEIIPKTINGLIYQGSVLELTNMPLQAYLKTMIQLQPDLSSVYVGDISGGLLLFENINVTKQKNFISSPNKELPSTADFALRFVDRSTTPPTEKYTYYNEFFIPVADEEIHPVMMDTRERPWYIETKTTKKEFWTQIYQYDPSGQPGITVAKGLYNSNGAFIGSCGADLMLSSLRNFLEKQKISENGKTVILNGTSGEIILPYRKSSNDLSPLDYDVINKAFEKFKLTNLTTFDLQLHDETFLAGIFTFPLTTEEGWIIMTVAPLSDFYGRILEIQHNVLIISVIIFVLASSFVVLLSKRISHPITKLANEIDQIKNLNLNKFEPIRSNIKEINILNDSIFSMRNAISSFAKYVPKEIVKQLVQQGRDIRLGGEKKDITIMFTDIVGFTHISEKMHADELMPLLSEYFDELSRIIIEKQGTIDKYIGDSIMAFWGAPKEITNPWSQACEAALRCLFCVQKMNEARKDKGTPQFITKFSLDAGVAIVGNIGTQERINYTAIGDVINSASRLQAQNSNYDTSIIISENVWVHVKDHFLTRPMDTVMVKGKENTIKIFELIAKFSSDESIIATEAQKKLCHSFTQAFEMYDKAKWDQSLSLFQDVMHEFPGDKLTQIYIERLQKIKNLS